MSVDQLDDALPLTELDAGVRTEELSPVVIVHGGSTDPYEDLLLSVANGDRQALAALQDRMGGLVHVNIRRVLRDAPRAEAVTQSFFAEMPRNATDFDPDRQSAQTWLLTHAHHRATDGLRSGHAAGPGDTATDQHEPPLPL